MYSLLYEDCRYASLRERRSQVLLMLLCLLLCKKSRDAIVVRDGLGNSDRSIVGWMDSGLMREGKGDARLRVE